MEDNISDSIAESLDASSSLADISAIYSGAVVCLSFQVGAYSDLSDVFGMKTGPETKAFGLLIYMFLSTTLQPVSFTTSSFWEVTSKKQQHSQETHV